MNISEYKMKILVNGYNLRQTSTGIANVIINAVNALVEKPEVIIELVVSPAISDEIKSRLSSNVVITHIGTLNSFVWLMYDFPKYVKKAEFDYIWTPTPLLPKSIFSKNRKVIVTINDFVSKDYRNTMTIKGRLITLLLEKYTISRADFLWCISNYTKSKLEEYYPQRKCSKIFVGCAPDSKIKKINLTKDECQSFLSRFGITKNYLLFVGSLEPRKNLSFLLRVFMEYHKMHENIQLVIVGARKWGNTKIVDIINSPEFPKADVIFTPFISEYELMTLYSFASCYVSTSLNEGYGLPQAEAMICGCPVVTAHNSAMIEVVDNAGITVKDWNIGVWISAIEEAWSKRKEIIERQVLKTKDFNWNTITDNLITYINNKS